MTMNATDGKKHAFKEETPLLDASYSSFHMSDRGSFRRRRSDFSSSSLSSVLISTLTPSERESALNRNSGIGAAALLIHHAVLGEKSNIDAWYDPYSTDQPAFRRAISLLCTRLTTFRLMARFQLASAWFLVLLAFIEPPHWCRDSDLQFVQDNVEESKFGDCGILLKARGIASDGEEDVEFYPNSNSMWLTVDDSRWLELACSSILAIFLALQFGSDGFDLSKFFFPGYTRLLNALRLSVLVLLFWAPSAGIFNPLFRLVLLGTYLKDFQIELGTLLKMLPKVTSILAILGLVIIFYAWFGVVVFHGSEQGERDFSDIFEACWTLWQCVTTVNYPDVMMPSFNQNRLAALYFISFMALCFFFIMNLILASVLNTYDEEINGRKKSRKKISNENLTKAFELMDPDKNGAVSREDIMALFTILNQDFPEIHSLSADEAKVVFGLLDKDGSNTITIEEFKEFGKLFLLEFTHSSAYETFVERHFPMLNASPEYKRFCDIVRSSEFDIFIDLILTMNAVVILIQSFPLLSGQDLLMDPSYSNGYIDTPWEVMETLFTICYVLEVIVKIMVNGWKKYSEQPRNMFDFFVTISAIFATAYVYYPNQYNNSILIRYVVMARVVRLVRLLLAFPAFQELGLVAGEILPAAKNVMVLLFFCIYAFATVGGILFGGMITRDPSNSLSFVILENDFSDSEYWANNFNDMASAVNVLFNLLVVNNFQVQEIGMESVTGGKWVRWYFVLFHVLGVILINNLVTSFIINAYFQQLETLNSRKEKVEIAGEATIRGQQAIFDASNITGTTTGATGKYYARVRAIHSDVEIEEIQFLKSLFGQEDSENNSDA